MIKNSAYEFPNSFYDFALMPKFQDCIEELRNLAEPEDWGYKNTTDTFKFPILKNYLLYTYQRIAEEKRLQSQLMRTSLAGIRG